MRLVKVPYVLLPYVLLEGETDAKDAAVIADQARIRRDLHPLRAGDETVTDLKILTGRRMDLVADCTRTVNRFRAQLTGIFPGLDRALDLTNTGPAHLADPVTKRRLPSAGSAARGWKRGCATARSTAPTSWPRHPSRPPSASTPACGARG
ncbi:hypothetical protein QFZ32_000595 [Streptomyces canus]|nr:hypothetical protein [Streptomyces canus]